MSAARVIGRAQCQVRDASSPKGAATSGPPSASSCSAWLPLVISVSRATHGTDSSRMFQTRPSTPPGRSTRPISADAATGSTQCQACPSTAASALSSGSARCSAVPTSVWMPGSAFRSASSIAASGSTAITSVPCSAVISATTRVSLPVPAPMSTTRGWAPAGSSSHATASAG